MKRATVLAAAAVGLALGGGAFAAGDGGGSTSTKTCKKGEVYDDKQKKCVEAERGAVSDDTLYHAARSLAYDGAFQSAIDLLVLAENQNDPRILNYLGFAHRKLGKTEAAMGYYLRALEIDPDYNLARSYMVQGLVADGKIDAARLQLAEIADRGGRDSWAYVMLENAIDSGKVY